MSNPRDTGLLTQVHAAYALLVLALLLLPLLALIPMSFGDSATITAIPKIWSLRWYREVTGSSEWRHAFYWSLLTATAASLMSTTIGYLGAVAIVRSKSRLRSVLELFILTPMMVPTVIVAFTTYMLAASLDLGGTWIAIAVGQSLLGLPVAALIIAASLRGIDETILRAAVSLGGNSRQVFGLVTLPMAMHGILSAAALSFLIAFDELLIAVFLTTPRLQTLPVRIYDSVQYELTPAVAVVSVFLMAVICVGLIISLVLKWAMRRLAEVRED